MSEQWMGLHNPERHEHPSDQGASCRECANICFCWRDEPCYCCLAAEVEALRAQVAAVRAVAERWHAVGNGWIDPTFAYGYEMALRSILRAIDGGDDERG